MNGVNIGANSVGFQKIVFESEVEFLAGGAYINPESAKVFIVAGETKVIPAGAIVGVKDGTDGTHDIVVFNPGTNPGDAEIPSGAILGFVHRDILLDEMPLASVLLSGVVRKEALPEIYAENIDALISLMPRFTFV